jgi:hypothetical protein
VDAAVVSRFISTGKPDLTPERQMMLSKILGLTNDQLLIKLYGDATISRVIPRPARGPAPSSNSNGGGSIEEAHAELKRAIEHVQELMPHATVTVTSPIGDSKTSSKRGFKKQRDFNPPCRRLYLAQTSSAACRNSSVARCQLSRLTKPSSQHSMPRCR